MKTHYICSLILLLGLFVFSCENRIEPDATIPANGRLAAAQGKVIFWTSSKTLGGAYIDVYISGKLMGRITNYATSVPACGASGHVTVSGDAGTYAFTATGQDGTRFGGTAKILSSQCTNFEITAASKTTTLPPRGAFMTFWTSQSSAFSSVDIWVDNTYRGALKSYLPATPNCQANGTVSVGVSAGTHTYKMQSNTNYIASGTVTVKDGDCLPIRFTAPTNTGGGTPNTATQVMFWTNSTRFGTIAVYVNNGYAGTITKSYGSAPACGTSGCVTTTLTSTSNTWYAKSSNGTRWPASGTNTYTLKPGCFSLQLY